MLLLPHTEKIFTAAIADPDKEIANNGLTKILTAGRNNDARSLRIFFTQDVRLNFEATTYYFDMIDWSLAEICSPPILQDMTDRM